MTEQEETTTAETAEVQTANPEPATQEPSLIDKANAAAMRLEKASATMEAQLQRLEKAQVEKTLGGKADVNVAPAPESDADYAKRALSGELENESRPRT